MHRLRFALTAAWRGLQTLIAPQMCASCGRVLHTSDLPPLCVACRVALHPTGWLGRPDNPMELLFRGYLPVGRAHAHYYYISDTPNTRLIFATKYEGRPEVGQALAAEVARELLPAGFFEGVDCFVPVPLAASRRRSRGYNQSEWIARGLSVVTGLPVVRAAKRPIDNPTQTHLDAARRQANVQGVFRRTVQAATLRDRHVMLVDDVVTTGATLRSLGAELLPAGPRAISLFALAATATLADPHTTDRPW